MRQDDVYVDLHGNTIYLAHLDAETSGSSCPASGDERRTHPDWDDFDNYWTRAVP